MCVCKREREGGRERERKRESGGEREIEGGGGEREGETIFGLQGDPRAFLGGGGLLSN